MNPSGSSKLSQPSALPSPASLFQRSTSSPSPFEAVYRSIDVDVLPMPRLSAPAPKAKAAATAVAQGDRFPHLMWPLAAYPLGQCSVFCADEPAALVERVHAQLVAQGCQVSREACNVLACSLNAASDNAHSRFSVAVWDVTYDPSAPAQPTLVDVQRLAGCPFLFQRVVGHVMCKPTERRFQCLPVPESFGSGAIEARDIDAAIERCTQGDTPARVEALVALSKQCASDALLRQSLCAADGRARLAGLLDDAPLAAHAERLFQLL